MSIEVILKEHVEHLGRRGEVVKVAAGLRAQLPVAAQAGPGRDRREQAADRARAGEGRSEGRGRGGRGARRSRRVSNRSRSPSRAASGENADLYGSVTSADIAEALAARDLRSIAAGSSWPTPSRRSASTSVPVKLAHGVTRRGEGQDRRGRVVGSRLARPLKPAEPDSQKRGAVSPWLLAFVLFGAWCRSSNLTMLSSPMDRTLPHNLEAEKCVLGAILINNQAFNQAAEVIDAQ